MKVQTVNSQYSELIKCLENIYKLDQQSSSKIIERLSLFFDVHQLLLKHFLSLSAEIVFIPVLTQQLSQLSEYDAMIKAPNNHKIHFENELLRILEVTVLPNETLPVHTHQWDSITIITQGSKFRVTDQTGNLTEEEWGISVDKFEGSLSLECYTNIDTREFRAISFEIKK